MPKDEIVTIYDDLTYIQIYDDLDNVWPISIHELTKLDTVGDETTELNMITLMTVNGQLLRIRCKSILAYIVSTQESREATKKFNAWSHQQTKDEDKEDWEK